MYVLYIIYLFQSLAELDGFYTLKATVTSAENTKGSEFLSSMKAQAFLENGLCDVINAWVLPNGGVIAVSFQTTNNTQSVNTADKTYKLYSNFYLRHIDQAPVYVYQSMYKFTMLLNNFCFV